jgi:hypothetical protein
MFSSSTHNVSVWRNALHVLFLPVICLDCPWRRLSLVSSLPLPGRIKTRPGLGRLRGGFFLTTTSLPWSPCSHRPHQSPKFPPSSHTGFVCVRMCTKLAARQLPTPNNNRADESQGHAQPADHVKLTGHKSTNERTSSHPPSPPSSLPSAGRQADVRVPIHVCDDITDAGTGNLATRLSTCMSVCRQHLVLSWHVMSCHTMSL